MPRISAEQPVPHHEVEPDIPAFEINRADIIRFGFLMRAFSEQTRNEVGEVEVTASMIESAAGEDGLTQDEESANKKTVREAFQFEDEEAAIISALAQGISPEPGESVPPQPAPAAENTPESLSKADLADPSRQEMLEAVREVARLEAMITKGRGTPEDRAMLERAHEVFEEKRLEYVGESFSRFADAQRQQIAARRERMEKKKGFMAGAYRVYEKMGELNLETLGWKPETAIKKFIAKHISAKTVVPVALLTGGSVLGAGSAVGMSAFFAKRLMAGPMAGMGAFGSLMNRTETKLSKPLEPEKVKALGLKEILDRMDAMAGHMLMSGKSPSENEAYKQLEARFIEITEAGRARSEQIGEWGGRQEMKEIMENADVRLAKAHKKAKTGKNVKKGIGAALGIFTGSGALAHVFGGVTHWFGETFGAVKGGAKAAAGGVLESHAPGGGHPVEASRGATIERPKRIASRGGGQVRAPRVPRANVGGETAQGHDSAALRGGNTESWQRGNKVAGFEHAERPGAVGEDPFENYNPKRAPVEIRRAFPSEASKPAATEVPVPETPRILNFNGGDLELVRDAGGKLTNVIVDCDVAIRPDDVLKDDWMMMAAGYKPGIPPSMIRSGLFGAVRDLRAYEIANHELSLDGRAGEEVRTMLGETIKILTAKIVNNYGNVLK